MNAFETVRNWLRNTYNIGASAEWLTACMEWLQQENQGVLPHMNDLKSQVYEQWLLSDLTEIGEPVLPQNLDSVDKVDLVSTYPLQLLSLVDVGFPLYGQKQKLQGRVNPNEEVSADKPFQPAWEPKPSRMLLLQLTDGHTQIKAMEYKQIKDLHPELPSGTKLLVCGTVLCRRGVIMLTSECVQVLGGDVEVLAKQNTPLTNLETMMVRSREDEGKHAKTEFSGKFLSRGTDKKIDSFQKPFMKVQDYRLGNQQQTSSMLRTPQIKLETCGQVSTSLRHLNMKQGSDPDVKKQDVFQLKQEGLRPKPEAQQWAEDINYDDCFNDDLDLDEIDALDSTLTVDMKKKSLVPTDSKSIRPNLDSASFVNPHKRESADSTSSRQHVVEDSLYRNRCNHSLQQKEDISQAVTSNLPKSKQQLISLPDMLDTDLVFIDDDDDFEMNQVSSTAVVNESLQNQGNKMVKHPSPKRVVQTSVMKRKNSQVYIPHKLMSQSSISNNNNFKSQYPLEQHHFNRTDSSSVLHQGMPPPANTSVKSKPSESFPLGNVQGNQPRTKSSPHDSLKSGSSRSIQAKKQCKLSDMFCSNSHKKTMVENCTIIEDHLVTQQKPAYFNDCYIINSESESPSLPLQIQKNAAMKPVSNSLFNLKGIPSEGAKKSPSMPAANWAVKSSREGADIMVEYKQGVEDTQQKLPTNWDLAIVSRTNGENFSTDIKVEEENTQQQFPKTVIHPSSSSTAATLSGCPDILPFQYLSSLANMQLPSSVTVKAYVSTLIGKLNSNEGQRWSLSCKINDGTASLDVDLADSVLSELIGFSAQDFVLMKQQITTRPEMKHILKEGLTRCQEKLINLSCLMKVEATSAKETSVVVQLIPVTSEHVCQLIERVSRCHSLNLSDRP